MKNKVQFLLPAMLLVSMIAAIVITGCAPSVSAASRQGESLAQPATEKADEGAEREIIYKTFTLPGPEAISFELPEGWDFWANAGYLSPDDGMTLAGLRQAWLVEGQDVERWLFNEDAIVLDETTVYIGEMETHRFTVETSLTNAATGEVFFHAFEMVYAFPAPNGEAMAGVFVSAPSLEALEPLVPVAEHMAASLQYGGE